METKPKVIIGISTYIQEHICTCKCLDGREINKMLKIEPASSCVAHVFAKIINVTFKMKIPSWIEDEAFFLTALLDCLLPATFLFPLQPLVFLQCTNYMLPCYPVPRTVIKCTKAFCKCNASKLAVYLSEISHKQTSLTLFSSTQCCLLGQTEHRTFCTNVTAATELNLLQKILRSRI